MATQVQFRRGTTGENSSFTGAQGEVTVDITKNTTVVHDGSTLGGFPLLREDGTNMALSSGSLSSCALKFASDIDTGLIRPAENQIAIVTGGTAQLSIDSAGAATFNNNVLISGSLTVSGGISGPTYFSAGTAAAPSITFVGDLNTGIYSPGADQVAITTNGVERLRTSTTGITATVPIANPPGAVTAPGITFAGDLNTGLWSPAADAIAASTGGSERLRIDSSGRVGIGTTSPDEALEVFGNIKLTQTSNSLIFEDSDSANLTINRFFSFDGALTADVDPNNNGSVSSSFRVSVDGTERARIDSSGRLLVGTSTSVSQFGVQPQIQSTGTSGASGYLGLTVFNTAVASAPNLVLGHSKGGTVGTYTASVDDDLMGEVTFTAANGTDMRRGASIAGYADGAWGTNDHPGRIVFSTTADSTSALTERMRIDSNGGVGIGGIAAGSTTLRLAKNITGGTSSFVLSSDGQIQSDVTSDVSYFRTSANTVDATFSLTSLIHYQAAQGTITGGTRTAPTNQYGFWVRSSLTGATNNYGFYSDIASSAGRWNFYANGTATNYFAGSVGVGTTSPSELLHVSGGHILLSDGYDIKSPDNFAIYDTAGTRDRFTFSTGNTYNTRTGGAHAFQINNSEAARIDSSGRLLVGTSTARANYYNGTDSTQAQIEGTTYQNTSLSLTCNASTLGNTGTIVFAKSAGTTIGSNTVVTNNHWLGSIDFMGSDGTEFVQGAAIACQVDGTPGANDMPGRLVFSTTADGASTPTERMRISSYGRVYIDTNAHQGNALSDTAPAKILAGAGTYTDTATAASGTVVHGPINTFDNPAIAATNATVTYTTASTVYIDGAPTAGTNVTITNPFAFFVGAGQSSLPAGTVGLPSLVFGLNKTTGLYSPATNQIGFSTAGTQRLLVDASGNFNFDSNTLYIDGVNNRVGIGTTSPSQPLHVTGNALIGGSPAAQWSTLTVAGDLAIQNASPLFNFVNAAGSARFGYINHTGTGGDLFLLNQEAGALRLGTSNLERARIDSSGRLLVGTATSSGSGHLLQVRQDGGANVELFTASAAANTGPYFVFSRSRGTAASPTVVAQDDRLSSIYFTGYSGTSSSYRAAAEIGAFVDGQPDTSGDTTDMPGRLTFSTTADGESTPTERMRISSYGRLYIDTNAHQGNALSDTAPAKILAGAGTYTDTTTAIGGTVVHGPINTFDNPAIAATNTTVTYTTASTVYIDGAPTAGTNVTITNPFAFFIGAGQTSVPAGTVGLPSVVFGLNKTSGIYSPATNQIGFSTAGVQRLLVDATGNFNFDSNTLYVDATNNRVGVGTSTPGGTLNVQSAASDVWADASNGLVINGGNVANAVSTITTYYDDSSIRIGAGVSQKTGLLITGQSSGSGSTVQFRTGNSERARIDSSGRLLVGTSSALDTALIGAAAFQVAGGTNATSQLSVSRFSGNSDLPRIALIKSRNGTVGGNTIVQNGDGLGEVAFIGADGSGATGYPFAASIGAYVDGTPGANDMPGRLIFSTTADGASSPTERMRISNDGRFVLNSQTHQGAAITTATPAKLNVSNGTYTDTTTAASGTVAHGPLVTFHNAPIAATNTGVIYTNASTFYIDGAPTAGTNVTITNPFAFFVNAGQSSFPLGTAGLPSITFGTNKTTGIYSPGTDIVAFTTAGTEVFRIDGSNRFLYGLSTARANFFNTTISPLYQQEGTTDQGRGSAIISSSSTAGSGAYLALAHQKSGTIGGNTLVAINDELGHVSFQGSDGTEFVPGGGIALLVDGTPAANDMPGRLVFYTTPDGTAAQTEKFRITQDGTIGFIQPTPAAFAAAATLSNANLFTGIIDYSGALATLTLPLGTTLETAFNSPYVNIAFEWSVINRGSGTVTIGANTGSTVSGSGAVAAGASGRFVTRRTAANTFVTYRLA